MKFADIISNCDQIKDISFANKLYASLCNRVWFNYIENEVIAFSWRGAAGFVARARSKALNTNEDYLDFYCGGNESAIKEIEPIFNQNGIVLFEGYYDDMSKDDGEKINLLFYLPILLHLHTDIILIQNQLFLLLFFYHL